MTSSSTADGMPRRGARSRGRSGTPLDLGVEDGDRARPGEGQLPGEHLVEHAAERVEVGARVDRPAGDLLGRHVLGRAEDREARLRALVSAARPASVSAAIATPKSSSFTPGAAASVSNRFCGLMSRWTRPAPCAASSARHASIASAHRLAPVEAPLPLQVRVERLAVEQLHRAGRRGRRATCRSRRSARGSGATGCATARASRRKRSSAPATTRAPAASTFSATLRPSSTCSAS